MTGNRRDVATSTYGIAVICIVLLSCPWVWAQRPYKTVLENAGSLADLKTLTAAGVTIETLKAETPGQLSARVSSAGGFATSSANAKTNSGTDDVKEVMLALPIWIYRLGTAYYLEGEPSTGVHTNYANAARILLTNMVYKANLWPVIPTLNPAQRNNQDGYWNTLWRMDQQSLAYAAIGYDRAYDGIVAGDRTVIENGFTNLVAQVMPYQTGVPYSALVFDNWEPAKGAAIATIGDIIDNDAISHYGRWYFHKFLHTYFDRDGEVRDQSHNYHAQMTYNAFPFMFLSYKGNLDDTWGRTTGVNPSRNLIIPRNFESTNWLAGYSTPAGFSAGYTPIKDSWIGTRQTYDRTAYTNYNFMTLWAERIASISNNVYETYATPTGARIAPADYEWDGTGTYTYRASLFGIPKSSLQAYAGMACLALGTGTNQTQVWIDFGRAVGHTHGDACNLFVYAHNTEMVGGTAYWWNERVQVNDGRKYNSSTLGQNVVGVYDIKSGNQFIQNHAWNVFNHDITGIYDIDTGSYAAETKRGYMTYGPNHKNKHNNVLMWDPGFKSVTNTQSIIIDAADAYKMHLGLNQRYSRFLSLVEVSSSPHRTYIIDIFRIKSGSAHTLFWMMGGGRQSQKFSVSVSETLSASITAPAGPLYPEEIRGEGATQDDVILTGRQDDFKEELITANNWNFTFSHELPVGTVNDQMRTYMTGKTGTRIIKGEAPRPTRYGQTRQDKMFAERDIAAGGVELFAAVHDPKDETHASFSVDDLEEILNEGTDGGYVGLEVDLNNGNFDYILQSEYNPPYSSPIEVMTSDAVNGTLLDSIFFAGKYGHVRVDASGNMVWMKCVDCGQLKYNGNDLVSADNDFGYHGNVSQTWRTADGQSTNALIVDQITGIPTSTALRGSAVLVQFSTPQQSFFASEGTTENTQGYIFGLEVDQVPNETNIYLTKDPGFVVTTYEGFEGAETVHFPIHHFPNTNTDLHVTWRIPGSAYTDGTTTNHTEQGDTSPPAVVISNSAFTAYNDLSWGSGQLNTKITRYATLYGNTGSNPDGDTGFLRDYGTGNQIDMTMTVTGMFHAMTAFGIDGGEPPAGGTDAANHFPPHIIDANGFWYHNTNKFTGKIALTNLYSNMLYDVSFYGDRDDATKSLWMTQIDIQGPTLVGFTNLSSAKCEFTGPTDSSTWVSNHNNNADGSIVCYKGIRAGNASGIYFNVTGSTNTSAGPSDNWGQYVNVMRVVGTPIDNTSTANAPPVVNATTGDEFELDIVKTLNGSYVDDGLPDPPGSVTSLWSVLNLPETNASVVITNAALTNATFGTDTLGVHWFNFCAYDGATSACQAVNVSVIADTSGNAAPVISNTVSSYSTTAPKYFDLSSITVSDDGLPTNGATDCSWSVATGVEAHVIFTDTEDIASEIDFLMPGTYSLRLSCDDTLLTTTTNVTINVGGNVVPFRAQ